MIISSQAPWPLVTLCAVSVAVTACGTKGGQNEYRGDADSGAAAPATTPRVTSPEAPDSTNGVGARSGKPGTAGVRQGTVGDATERSTP